MKKRRNQPKGVYENTLPVIVVMVIAAAVIIAFFKMYELSIDMDHAQRDIAYLNSQIQTQASGISQTEYLKTIDFLETETAKYRAFVEKQQEFMVWLVGLIGTIFTGLTVWFGIRSRHEIAATVKEEYSSRINQAVSEFVGGQEKVKYLEKSIEREEQAGEKRILFLLQKQEKKKAGEDKDQEARDSKDKEARGKLGRVADFLEEQGFRVRRSDVSGKLDKMEIEKRISGQDIVVYQMAREEYFQKDAGKDAFGRTNYNYFAQMCNEKKIYGILYCEEGMGIDRKSCDFSFYVSSANYGSTLLERIYNLLYIVQDF